MSTGPSPALGGFLIENAASAAAQAQDANGAVSLCPSGGVGAGGASSEWLQSGGGSGSGFRHVLGMGGGDSGDRYVEGAGGRDSGYHYIEGAGGGYRYVESCQKGDACSCGQANSSDGSGLGDECGPTSGSTAFCVAGNTRISLYPEGCCEAWELKMGDIVMSRTSAGIPVGEAVERIVTSMQPCVRIETDGRDLTCSLSHHVMAAGDGSGGIERKTAAELTLADRIALEDGSSASINSLYRQGEMPVYQISLTGPNHVYITNGIWSSQ